MSYRQQYIDAAMVGSLGKDATASIGLVTSTTWFVGGLCISAAMGFSVQAAQNIGAKEEAAARDVLRQSLLACGGSGSPWRHFWRPASG